MKRLIFLAAFATLLALEVSAAQLSVTTLTSDGSSPLPARLHLAGPDGNPVRSANALPFFRDHVSSPGRAEFEVNPGTYRLTVERGPEWRAVNQTIEIQENSTPKEVAIRLARIVDLSSEGWWSGETHIHRRQTEVEALMRAEDLHFGQLISWWNATNPWKNAPLPSPLLAQFDGNRFVHQLGGEDERDGGALLFFNLDQPVDITTGKRHFPSSLGFARQAKEAGAWIDIEKPFWWDVPMWIAHGIGDSIGIAQNHMQRSGVLDTEAWGKPRDRDRYAGPQGNGRWTQEIYYHLLNSGVRLPPSAGSASGVLPNPVGYNRAYVHFEGAPAWDKWCDGLRGGRVVVTNGPLLRVRANGQLPGHTFRAGAASLDLAIDGRLDSRDPIAAVELVRNGRVERITLPARVTIQESGWFLVRAIADVAHTFRFASTGPFYVELGNAPAKPARASARFFVDWCDERIATLSTSPNLDAAQREDVLQPWRTARAFWQAKVEQSIPTGELRGEVVDAATGALLAARIYLRDESGRWHFIESASAGGAAVRYEKRNWVNLKSEEFHTTVSAHPFRATLPPGRYELVVERGKEYFPATTEVIIGGEPVSVRVSLKRWINVAERGWFSGDTHVHRTTDELRTVMLAEDVNVAFPLSYWITRAFTPPAAGDKNSAGSLPGELIQFDATHVVWPCNTEYEIFMVGGARHTLGAVFVLGHTSVFTDGVPPVSAVAARARAEGALLDMDKHDWPWAMALPPLMDVQLYELANNHVWRTEFGFTSWSTPAPPHLRPPFGGSSGGEREWIHYTLGNYYALLNCGFRLRPTAGTASGVHPVPLGFGRVYVHLPEGFSYEAWKQGLDRGRSFVTTGPMLFARVNDREPGEVFHASAGSSFKLTGSIVSEQPVAFAELIHNGVPVRLLRVQNRRTAAGASESTLEAEITLDESGWLAVRCWEDRPGGRVRFAHTAPWHVEIAGKPLLAPAADREHLISRMRAELDRSRAVLPPEAIAEYEKALAAYQRVAVRDDAAAVRRSARWPESEAERRTWLENMVWHHRFTAEEVRAATGLSAVEIAAALKRFDISDATRPKFSHTTLRVLPYPGGRHPRTGFFDGAIDPQRETKVSVFTPWDDTSYVVVDVPEAIRSDLGLTNLAHTHVPTIWSTQGVTLPPLEWNRHADGSLDFTRTLPNQIAFGAKVVPGGEAVRFELWLRNGTDRTLTDLRVQNCVMLKGAAGFSAQSNQNKLLQPPFAAVRSDDGRRWIITAWEGCQRTWANPPVPCLHSDPQFPDCPPGGTRRLHGWLWFYEGADIQSELQRLQIQIRVNTVD